jgi:PKHD-type hydroxylase
MLVIENLVNKELLEKLQNWMAAAVFEDGRATAGGMARLVKNNEQVSSDPDNREPKLDEMQDLVLDALFDNELFSAAAQPKEVMPPLFSRYTEGKAYGLHMDNATISDYRADMSLTLFLSEPADYDGGELVIYFPTGERSIKLAAGSAVLYPTSAFHEVKEVTRGQRQVCVTWIRSFVRDPAAREILFDLRMVRDRMQAQYGKTIEVDLISKSYTNLLRRWLDD